MPKNILAQVKLDTWPQTYMDVLITEFCQFSAMDSGAEVMSVIVKSKARSSKSQKKMSTSGNHQIDFN